MKAYEHWVSKHFLISLNFPCLSLLTVLFCLCRIFFFGCFVVRDLRRSGFRHNLATSSSFKTPSLPRGCFSFPTQNSLSHINDSYRISWNNSRHSINRLPRIIDPLWPKYLKYSPPSNNRPSTAPLAIFSSFYLLLVKLKCNEIRQNWSVMIQALKINQGTKFGTVKTPMFSIFDVTIFWFNRKIKQNIN